MYLCYKVFSCLKLASVYALMKVREFYSEDIEMAIGRVNLRRSKNKFMICLFY